ncbi:MAG TPA: hypothetical protein VIN09_02790 [Chloroflexota bacterium]
MTPRQFLQHMMHEYERQWASALGHAPRHLLHEKMRALDTLIAETSSLKSDAEFEDHLRRGCSSGDPLYGFLCEELLPLWQEAQRQGDP